MNENNGSCEIVRKKTEDFPGEEWFVWYCRTHRLEVSEEWIERHNGLSEPVPAVNCPAESNGRLINPAA